MRGGSEGKRRGGLWGRWELSAAKRGESGLAFCRGQENAGVKKVGLGQKNKEKNPR